MVFTSPTGHRWTTEPGGALLFPGFAVPTGNPVTPTGTGPADPHRGLAMPTRRRTRDEDRQARIDRERARRAEINAERARQRAAHLAYIKANDPPPF